MNGSRVPREGLVSDTEGILASIPSGQVTGQQDGKVE